MEKNLELIIAKAINFAGYENVISGRVTRNDILRLVSEKTNMPIEKIKKMIDYKTIIDAELKKIKKISSHSDVKPLDSMVDKFSVLRMKEPDIRSVYVDENPMDSVMDSVMDKFSVLSLKDPENFKKEVINLNMKESRNYILDLEYRNYINSILDKNNKKLSLIVVAMELCEIMLTIPNIVKNLQELDLYQVENLKLNKELEKFTSLEKLTNIKPLEKFVNLRILKLKRLENLSDITPIEKLVNLQTLDLWHLEKLEDITPLVKLKNLKNLRIFGYRPSHIKVIENLKLETIQFEKFIPPKTR